MKKLLLVIVFASGVALGQVQFEVPSDISKVMTPKEQRAIGVDKMTASQKAALEKWMKRYAVMVANDLVQALQK